MSPEALALAASRFKVLSEPMRLEILQVLRHGETSVNDLTEKVASTQPNVSKHLRVLQDADLVARRRSGSSVFYRIADETVFKLCDVVCDSLKHKFKEQAAIFA
ncbi:MAG: metalloregulator ArsR/SmtB family transcription factor [Acidobacteria bacterium]|nr:metalloregulator ArsR/SmtB family transcription factor [Acidobacteriota bacterium]